MKISEMNWLQVEEYLKADDRAVVPLGCTEQHAYLSLSVDSILAERVAVDAAAPSRVPVFPVQAYGITPYFLAYPGTVSLRAETYLGIITDILDSLRQTGFRRILFVNGHGGNATAMTRADDVLTRESRRAVVWWPSVPGGDPHAGHVETSLMLALAPGEVHLDRAVAGPVPVMADLVRVGVQPLSPSGVLGDPTRASAEAGRQLFDELAAQLVAAVARRFE